jgi:hypothetical protein
VVLIGVGAAVVWRYRVDIVTWEVARVLESQGLGPATFAIDAIEWGSVRARDVALLGGAIKAGELIVFFRPMELLSGHLGSVEIGHFIGAFAVGKDGVELNGKPLASGVGGKSPIAALRVDAFTLRDARLSLATASGPVEAALSTTLAVADGEVRALSFTAKVTAPVAGGRRTANITAQEILLQPEAADGAWLTVKQAAVTPEGLPWAAQAIDGKLVWRPDQRTAEVAIGRLVNRQQPMLVSPLGLVATARLTGTRLVFSLQATGGKGMLKLQAKGQHDIASNRGSANIALAPILFRRGSLQPGDLFPALAGRAEDIDGSVALAGPVRWTGSTLSPDLTLKLKDLAFALSSAQLRQLNGEIKLTRLWPPATAPGQTVTAMVEATGLPPARLSLTGQLAGRPALTLERTVFDFAGGEITASPFAIDPAAPRIQTTLRVDHVDLAEITKLLGISGLTGTGRLDGPIPLVVESGKVAIAGGRLTAREPGVLSYRPGSLPPEIAKAGGSVELALQALSDFQYDRLTLELDKSSGGEGTVLLRLEGRNPALMSGQPFNFNIRIDSNFDRLADYALLSLRSAQELLRRAAGRAGP